MRKHPNAYHHAATNEITAPVKHCEGNTLHRELVHDLGVRYLAGTIAEAVRASSAAAICKSKVLRCRFLFVNIAFSRDEFPCFAQLFSSAVFATIAGSSPRLSGDGASAPLSSVFGCSRTSIANHSGPWAILILWCLSLLAVILQD